MLSIDSLRGYIVFISEVFYHVLNVSVVFDAQVHVLLCFTLHVDIWFKI